MDKQGESCLKDGHCESQPFIHLNSFLFHRPGSIRSEVGPINSSITHLFCEQHGTSHPTRPVLASSSEYQKFGEFIGERRRENVGYVINLGFEGTSLLKDSIAPAELGLPGPEKDHRYHSMHRAWSCVQITINQLVSTVGCGYLGALVGILNGMCTHAHGIAGSERIHEI